MFIFPGAPQSHQGARDAMKLVSSGTGGETDTTTESDTTTVVSSTDHCGYRSIKHEEEEKEGGS